MAGQKINIDIQTKADTTGLKNVGKGLDHAVKGAGKAAGALAGLGGVIGEINGPAAKATRAIGGMLGAFMTGGPIGMAIAGVAMLVSKFVSLKNAQEEARKQDLRDKLEREKKALKEAADEAERYAAALSSLKKAQLGQAGAETEAANAAVDADTAAKTRGGVDENDAKIIKAQGEMQKLKNDLALAQKKFDMTTAELQAKRDWTADPNAAAKKRDALNARIDQLLQDPRAVAPYNTRESLKDLSKASTWENFSSFTGSKELYSEIYDLVQQVELYNKQQKEADKMTAPERQGRLKELDAQLAAERAKF